MPELIGIAGDARAVDAVSTFLGQGGCYVIQPDESAWIAVCYEIAEALGHPDCGLVVVLVATRGPLWVAVCEVRASLVGKFQSTRLVRGR